MFFGDSSIKLSQAQERQKFVNQRGSNSSQSPHIKAMEGETAHLTWEGGGREHSVVFILMSSCNQSFVYFMSSFDYFVTKVAVATFGKLPDF